MKEEPAAEAPGPGPTPGTLSALLRDLAADEVGSSDAAWDVALAAGQQVGRFRLLRELGRGGFGVVFEAEDTQLRRKVALKAVRTGRRGDLRKERLLEEAEAAARLAHPNIVTLYDLGRSEHGPYLVLELLEGETLQTRVERGAVPPSEAVRIATGIARGLAHAHERGVVHRDLKPGNVFLTRDGGVKILDFGLAHAFGLKRIEGGTPAYMAPEQWAGAPEDERTDVFALGVVLYRMLAGKVPFRHEDPRELKGPAPAPHLEVAGLPALGELVAAMLEKSPVDRPRDGGVVLRALELVGEVLRGAGPSAPGSDAVVVRRGRPEVVPWWRGRRAATAGLAALVLAVAALGVAARLRGHDAVAGRGRVVVAVADLANETGDPELDPMSRLLSTSLEQSAHLDVVPRSRLVDAIRLAGGEEAPRLDEARGREAARRTGAGTLLLAAVFRFGARYVVELRAVEPGGDRALFSIKEQADAKEALPELLDRLSAQVRSALGEPRDQVGRTAVAARTVTASFAAWRHYTAGLDCVAAHAFAGTFEECLPHFDRAVAVDPGFALAHYQRSRVLDLQGAPRAQQREAMAAALQHLERVPARDRAQVQAWAAYLDGREMEAKRLARQAAEASPDDKWLWWLAAEMAYRRDEFEEAAELFARVHALDPTLVVPAVGLVTALGARGDREAIRRVVAGLEALGGSRPDVLVSLCHARLWTDPGAAVAACREARTKGAGAVGDGYLAIALLNTAEREELVTYLRSLPDGGPLSFGWFMRLLLAAEEGRWRDFEREAGSAEPADYSWLHATLAEAWLGKGDVERARRAAERTVALEPGNATNLAVHLAFAGDLAGASGFADLLPPASPRLDAYRAIVRWRSGDLEGALPVLQRLAAAGATSTDPAIPFPVFVYAEALAASGRHAEAAKAYERFLGLPMKYPSWQVPRGILGLARSRLALGDRNGARQALGRLLSIWKSAVPGQPGLVEARGLAGALGLEGP